MTLINKIIKALEPIVIKNGQELIEVVFEENSSDKKLKVIVGSLNGPGIKELTKITKEFNKLNEDGSIIPFDFSLDVSSPGLDRPLTSIADFKRNLGKEINVKYKGDKDLIQKDIGMIEDIAGTDVIVNIGKNENKVIQIKNVIKAKLVIKIGKRK